jgi:hypothetical protein
MLPSGPIRFVGIMDGRTPASPPAPTRLAARCRRRVLHGLRLVRRRVQPSPSQPRSQAMEEGVDASRCGSVHGLQRLRSDLPFSCDHHAKGLKRPRRRARRPGNAWTRARESDGRECQDLVDSTHSREAEGCRQSLHSRHQQTNVERSQRVDWVIHGLTQQTFGQI